MTTIDRHTDDKSKLTAITVPQYGTIRYEMLHVFLRALKSQHKSASSIARNQQLKSGNKQKNKK